MLRTNWHELRGAVVGAFFGVALPLALPAITLNEYISGFIKALGWYRDPEDERGVNPL